jgi:hypothetical protein
MEHLKLFPTSSPRTDLGGFGMWTNENRGRYDRSKLRYPSDLTDDEWAWIKPLIPPAKRGGNKRTVNERALSSTV